VESGNWGCADVRCNEKEKETEVKDGMKKKGDGEKGGT